MFTNNLCVETDAMDLIKWTLTSVTNDRCALVLILSSKLVAPVRAFLGQFTSKFVVYSGEKGATISLAWIGNGGVIIFLAGIIGGFIQGATLLAALTGSFFPALAPVVGIIGTFVTGSTTSSGILFGIIVCALSYLSAVLI